MYKPRSGWPNGSESRRPARALRRQSDVKNAFDAENRAEDDHRDLESAQHDHLLLET